MLKRYKYFVFAAAILILFVVFFILFNYNCYKLTPNICELALGESPKDFVQTNGGDSIISNSYTYAKMDRDGNLILILSNSQLRAWKENSISIEILRIVTDRELDIGKMGEFVPADFIEENIIELAKNTEIEVSEDYKKIIVKSNSSTIISWALQNACTMMQIFNDVEEEDFLLEILIYNNGELTEHKILTAEG